MVVGYWGVFTLEPNDGRGWGSWILGVFTLEPNDGKGSLSQCPGPE